MTDPFGRLWQAEFRWHQNAISIRHCDAVDCKYHLSCEDEKREVVVALVTITLFIPCIASVMMNNHMPKTPAAWR